MAESRLFPVALTAIFIVVFTPLLTPSDSSDRRPCLLPDDVLDLADLFLNVPVNIFGLAFVFQVAVPDSFSGDLLNLALGVDSIQSYRTSLIFETMGFIDV